MILPPPGEAFEWRKTPFGPSLVCTPLEAFAAHLFTTRPWSLGQPRSGGQHPWNDVAEAFGLPPASLVRMKQVHGRATLVADRGQAVATQDGLPEADIVVTSDRTRAVAVQAADCVPLLIADRRLGVVAAAHAGWRGLALGVPRAAVEALVATFGSRLSDLLVAVGPSVGACCYEVGPDVRQAFAAGGFSSGDLDRWFCANPTPTVLNRSLPGLPPDRRPGHWYFDGWASAREQLLATGIDEPAIFSAGLCTASHPEALCSYRRDGTASGRIAAAIRPSER